MSVESSNIGIGINVTPQHGATKQAATTQAAKSENQQRWLRALESESFDEFGEQGKTKNFVESNGGNDTNSSNPPSEVSGGASNMKAPGYTEISDAIKNTSLEFGQVQQFINQSPFMSGSMGNKPVDATYAQYQSKTAPLKMTGRDAGVVQKVFDGLVKKESKFSEVNIHLSESDNKRTLLLRNFFIGNEVDKKRWVERLHNLFQRAGVKVDEIIINGQELKLEGDQ